MLSDGIALTKNSLAMSLFIGFLILEIAKSRAFARLRGFDPVRARGNERAVFEAVDERVESTDRGSLAGRKASHLSEPFFATKFRSELWNGREAEKRHKQERAEHAERVNRRAATR
jgi:hypothetical protein